MEVRKRRVWRVQNRAGQGPYRDVGLALFLGNHGHRDENHPTPREDSFLRSYEMDLMHGYFFGFASKEQAEKWFAAPEMKVLNELGYYLVRVPTDRLAPVIASPHQAIFKPRRRV